MNTLKDKSIVVTGGAAGMGREMVLALARSGAKVTAADVSQSAIEALSCELHQTGLDKHVHFECLDLCLEHSSEQLILRAVERFGPVYGLVNNAGIGRATVKPDFFKSPPKFWEMTSPQWERFVAINASAVFRTMRAVSAGMLAMGTGRIINVTTSIDSMLSGGAVGYGPSKSAAESLSAVAANDFRGTGVTVNVLIPGGPVGTAMIPDDAPIAKESLLKADCMIEPLLWLLSDEAANTTALRITAHRWPDGATGEEGIRLAGAPIAWTQLTGQIRNVQMTTTKDMK